MKALPALLTNSQDEFIKQIHDLSPFFSYYQIDICDGNFVPSTTLSVSEVTQAFEKIDKNLLKNLAFDFDLMVTDYEQALADIAKLQDTINIKNIFIHVSALEWKPLPTSEKYAIGIAIDPKDTIEEIGQHYSINQIPCIQIMTVVPGFQGSPFREQELKKIEELRNGGYGFNIYLDGGVNDKTIPKIASYTHKPDYLGIGSFLSKAPSIQERVDYLNSILG